MKFKIFTVFVFIVLVSFLIIFSNKFLFYYDFSNELIDKINEYEERNKELRKRNKVCESENEGYDLLKFKYLVYSNEHPMLDKILNVVWDESNVNDIDPLLIASIIKTESNYNKYARSSYAYGLMQINYNVWCEKYDIDFKRIFDLKYNVRIGIKIFRHYFMMADKNIHKALHYYNNGPSGYYNNIEYSPKVLFTYNNMKE